MTGGMINAGTARFRLWGRGLLPFLLALALPGLTGAAITDASTSSGAAAVYDGLRETSQRLLVSGSEADAVSLKRLGASATNAEVRETLSAAMGLFWLSQRKLADAAPYTDYLRASFPNSRYLFLLQKDANITSCLSCHASGAVTNTCLACGGTGRCRICGGRGTVPRLAGGGISINASADMRAFSPRGATAGSGTRSTPVTIQRNMGDGKLITMGVGTPAAASVPTDDPCSACKGSKLCDVCKGTKVVKVACSACNGTGGTFNGRASEAFSEVVTRLGELASNAANLERGMLCVDGRWADGESQRALLRSRANERAYFMRVTDEAEHARKYDVAVSILDNALARYPASIYTGDVLRVKELIRNEASERTPKELLGPERATAAAGSATHEIPQVVEALLNAAQRGTNAPVYCVKGAVLRLPVAPLRWTTGVPDVLDRTARVSVEVERPSRSGFALSERWIFLMVHEDGIWRAWGTAGPW